MSLQHIQKNSPRLLPKPAKFEKNPPNGYRVIRKTKCGAGGAAGAGGAGSSPIHKQASLAGRLITVVIMNAWLVIQYNSHHVNQPRQPKTWKFTEISNLYYTQSTLEENLLYFLCTTVCTHMLL